MKRKNIKGPFILLNSTISAAVRNRMLQPVREGLSILPTKSLASMSEFNIILSHNSMLSSDSIEGRFRHRGKVFSYDSCAGMMSTYPPGVVLNAQSLQVGRVGHTISGKLSVIFTLFHELGHVLLNKPWHYRLVLPIFHQFKRKNVAHAKSPLKRFMPDVKYMIFDVSHEGRRGRRLERSRVLKRGNDDLLVGGSCFYCPGVLKEFLAEMFAYSWMIAYVGSRPSLRSLRAILSMKEGFSRYVLAIERKLNRGVRVGGKGSRSGSHLPANSLGIKRI